jgi:2-C-methyl-D-erythritol 4-phosphate cytidylyltransferase
LSSVAAIITAAGSSERWADTQKKEYVHIEGRSVLSRTIQPFFDLVPPLRIVVTLPEGDLLGAGNLLQPVSGLERILFIAGGGSRQESVCRGLEALREQPPEFVLIHDGARPWIECSLIQNVLEGARRWGACIPTVHVTEALKRVDTSGKILEDLPREQYRLAQTPQGFLYQKILRAHQQARESAGIFYDDAEVYATYCGDVFTVCGERKNRKITYKEDIADI